MPSPTSSEGARVVPAKPRPAWSIASVAPRSEEPTISGTALNSSPWLTMTMTRRRTRTGVSGSGSCARMKPRGTDASKRSPERPRRSCWSASSCSACS